MKRSIMMNRIVQYCVISIVFLFHGHHAALADVTLPAVINHNMVLQRDQALPIWGWADADEAVNVALGDNSATTKADAQGNWSVKLKPMQADGGKTAHTLIIKGKNEIKLQNILIGEVWVCSGQSNMEWSVSGTLNAQKEIEDANHPAIRLFQVPKRPASQPEKDVRANWVVCSPQTVGGFSAVAYFFARHLQKETGLPIGVINTSWGGTRIEPWTPAQGFRLVPELAKHADWADQSNKNYAKAQLDALTDYRKWLPLANDAEREGKPIPAPPQWPINPVASHNSSTGLYNGMVAPLVPYAIAGAIWYQGESNRGNGMHYLELSKALIGGWREVWKQETNKDFPFLIVQLAPYNYGNNPTALPEIWEAQTACLTAIPNTGLAVTTDIGDVKDIHPRNKQEVGRRLALWALAKTYGKTDLVYSGPLFKSLTVDGKKAIITFDHIGSGLAVRDKKPLTHFQIAGEDKVFVPAKAEIVGDTIEVEATTVTKPVAVRFGWDHMAEPNLINKEGLPAGPFRTDKW